MYWLQIYLLITCDPNLPFHHLPRVFCLIAIWWLEVISPTGMNMISRWAVVCTQCLICAEGSKVCKKTSTPHNHHQPEAVISDISKALSTAQLQLTALLIFSTTFYHYCCVWKSNRSNVLGNVHISLSGTNIHAAFSPCSCKICCREWHQRPSTFQLRVPGLIPETSLAEHCWDFEIQSKMTGDLLCFQMLGWSGFLLGFSHYPEDWLYCESDYVGGGFNKSNFCNE